MILKKKTIFNKNPLDQAKIFQDMGCDWIHIVDLDGAKNGNSDNFDIVKEIALKTDTPEGKKIFEDLMNYEEMLKKMIEIDYERRNSLIKLTNEKRLKRAYNDRIKRFFESKLKQTEINLKSIINRHLKTLQIKINKIKTLEKENKILKDRIRELESINT